MFQIFEISLLGLFVPVFRACSSINNLFQHSCAGPIEVVDDVTGGLKLM